MSWKPQIGSKHGLENLHGRIAPKRHKPDQHLIENDVRYLSLKKEKENSIYHPTNAMANNKHNNDIAGVKCMQMRTYQADGDRRTQLDSQERRA